MVEKSKLERLREAIEMNQARPSQRSSYSPEAERAQDLREAQWHATVEARSARIKSGVEGTAQKPLDISKADLGKSRDSKIRAIGHIYSLLNAPLSKAAEMFSKLPAADQLKKNLATSSMTMSVESYLALSTTVAFIAAMMCSLTVVALDIGFAPSTNLPSTAAIALIVWPLSFILAGVLMMLYPSFKSQSRASEVDRELPFALRQLSTQVRAGASFQRAIYGIAQGDYPTLSDEFRHLIKDIESGKSTVDALKALHGRTSSRGLRQACMQIMRAMKTGGPLSEITENIADEVAFETRMRIRDFTEQLNLISIVFVMVAVVAPVMVTIIAAVSQLPMLGLGLGNALVIIAFCAVVGSMFIILGIIKKLEPMV